MKGDFGEILRAAWEWTRTIVFRPFSFKKWIFLCLIALMAGEISSCNLNLNLPLDNQQEQSEQAVAEDEDTSSQQMPAADPVTPAPADQAGLPAALIAIFVLLGIVIGGALLLLFAWLYSRFSFIFLESIIRNDASIREPFRRIRKNGNSYFVWNIIFALIFIALLAVWGGLLAGIIYLFRKTLIVLLLLVVPWVLGACGIIIAVMVVNVLTRDLVLPVVYKENISVFAGWKRVLPVISREKYNTLMYLLIKAGLRLLTALAAGVVFVIAMMLCLLPLLVIGALLYSFSLVLPLFLRVPYYVLLIMLGVIVGVLMLVLLNMATLPIPVYFRTFSLKFLARLDEGYDLFRLTAKGE